jgi:predicted transcriptional regulator
LSYKNFKTVHMIKKENSRATWTPEEMIALRELSEMGANNKDIARVLGRTPNAVSFQKSVRGIHKNRDAKFTGIRTGNTMNPVVATLAKKQKKSLVKNIVKDPIKDPAKEITRVARQIARHNGKRITMAMFFVEDID